MTYHGARVRSIRPTRLKIKEEKLAPPHFRKKTIKKLLKKLLQKLLKNCPLLVIWPGSGIVYVPIFVGPGLLMMAPGSHMSQYL